MGNKLFAKTAVAEPWEPNGMYPTCEWDTKVVKKMVLARRCAPRFRGLEDTLDGTDECPICFNSYAVAGALNRTVCCRQMVCSECFFQVQPPTLPNACPFCQAERFAVTFDFPGSEAMSRAAKIHSAQASKAVDVPTPVSSAPAVGSEVTEPVEAPRLSRASIAERKELERVMMAQSVLHERPSGPPAPTAHTVKLPASVAGSGAPSLPPVAGRSTLSEATSLELNSTERSLGRSRAAVLRERDQRLAMEFGYGRAAGGVFSGSLRDARVMEEQMVRQAMEQSLAEHEHAHRAAQSHSLEPSDVVPPASVMPSPIVVPDSVSPSAVPTMSLHDITGAARSRSAGASDDEDAMLALALEMSLAGHEEGHAPTVLSMLQGTDLSHAPHVPHSAGAGGVTHGAHVSRNSILGAFTFPTADDLLHSSTDSDSDDSSFYS